MTDDILRKLPEINPQFSNDHHAKEFYAKNPFKLNPNRLNYFEAYSAANFNNSLTPGFGTEELLDLLATVPANVDWLDLGAGTTSLFWTAALRSCKSITAVDIFPEALEILRLIVAQNDISDCTVDALVRYNRPRSHIATVQALNWRYLVFDFAQRWPEQLILDRYDLITAFGCFGLGSNAPEHFKNAMANTTPFLAPKGQIIGANWLRTETSIATEGYDTSFLTEAFIAEECERNGIILDHSHIVSFDTDPRFSGILVWKGVTQLIGPT